MSELSDRYKQALESDFIKFTTFIMLGYLLKQFSNPQVQLDNIVNAWSERVNNFRKNALEDYDGDADVVGIMTSIIDLDEGLDRNTSIKEVKEHFKLEIENILKTF